jgi:hypothetical protein
MLEVKPVPDQFGAYPGMAKVPRPETDVAVA